MYGILQSVAHKPITNLRRIYDDYLLMSRTKTNRRTDREQPVQIKCCDCQATYIGETGRNLSTRLTGHFKRAT